MVATHLPERTTTDRRERSAFALNVTQAIGDELIDRSRVADFLLRTVSLASWGLFAVVCMQWFLIRCLGDVWWVGTIALYAPRWPLLLPISFVAGVSAVCRRRLFWINLASSAILLGPVMGFCVPSPFGGPNESALQIRVLTANTGGSSDERLRQIIAAEKPDIVALQEFSAKRIDDVLGPDWHHSRLFGVSIFSRYPVSDSSRFRGQLVGRFGDIAVRVKAHTPAGPIWIYSLHLNTPRWGFEEFAVTRYGIQGIQAIKDNTAQRDDESRQIRDWVDEVAGPKIILGDLNMPVESGIFRRDWSSFTDAYSATGFGYGLTKFSRWIGVRIDHILTNDAFQVISCKVTSPAGGDHRPILADALFLE